MATKAAAAAEETVTPEQLQELQALLSAQQPSALPSVLPGSQIPIMYRVKDRWNGQPSWLKIILGIWLRLSSFLSRGC